MARRTKGEHQAVGKMERKNLERKSIADSDKHSTSADIPASRMEEAMSELAAGITTGQVRAPNFVTSVVSISKDRSSVKVRLCTGSLMDVPVSILKNVTHLGTVTNGEECLGIASGEIDVSTDIGKLIQKMAREIHRLSNSLEAAQEGLRRSVVTDTTKFAASSEETATAKARAKIIPFDTVLPLKIVKLPVNGIAGGGYNFTFYQPPVFQYIQEWEVIAHPGCFFTDPPFVNADGVVVFFVDASHGTPLGTAFTATIILSVVLVQRTT
jgi:hypothetical protein